MSDHTKSGNKQTTPKTNDDNCPICECGIGEDGWCHDNHSPIQMAFVRGGSL